MTVSVTFRVLSHGFRHSMRGAAHTRNAFNTEKPFLCSSHTLIYLVHTIQPNSPLSLMLSFFYLHYNVIQRGCHASWIINNLLAEVFVISGIVKVEVSEADNTNRALDYFGYRKNRI